MKRRDLLKGFASIPLLGFFSWGIFKKSNDDKKVKEKILDGGAESLDRR